MRPPADVEHSVALRQHDSQGLRGYGGANLGKAPAGLLQ